MYLKFSLFVTNLNHRSNNLRQPPKSCRIGGIVRNIYRSNIDIPIRNCQIHIVETGIQTLEQTIDEILRESVSQELVMLALNKFTDVFDHIQPYHQRELLRLVLHKAVLAPDKIKIALYGRPPEIGQLSVYESEIRSQTPTWLPSIESNSNL